MAKHVKWLPCHVHVIRLKLTDDTTFDDKGLKTTQAKFEVDLINSLGVL